MSDVGVVYDAFSVLSIYLRCVKCDKDDVANKCGDVEPEEAIVGSCWLLIDFDRLGSSCNLVLL